MIKPRFTISDLKRLLIPLKKKKKIVSCNQKNRLYKRDRKNGYQIPGRDRRARSGARSTGVFCRLRGSQRARLLPQHSQMWRELPLARRRPQAQCPGPHIRAPLAQKVPANSLPEFVGHVPQTGRVRARHDFARLESIRLQAGRRGASAPDPGQARGLDHTGAEPVDLPGHGARGMS